MRRTKIVATVGPACETPEMLGRLVEAGLNVARLNFSHGSHPWHSERIRILRRLEQESGAPLAILQDLSGPKLRVGEIPGDGIELREGEPCFLVPAASVEDDRRPAIGHQPPVARRRSSAVGRRPPRVPLPVPALFEALKPGDQLFLDDGMMELVVDARSGEELRCEVVTGGRLTSRKGVTARGVSLDIPSLTERDREDLRLGIAHQVDWIAISYVRRARDLEPARRLIAEAGASIPIIAKIEKWEAVQNLEEILEAADGLMVARGDLGVEMPLPEVPAIQKRIIRLCNRAGKPVITATQMLESMVRNPRPTRAEVTDVANAILDGTDAVMLSAETAVGAYPVAAVQMMAEIARRTESHIDHAAILARRRGATLSITGAISHAACQIAAELGASAIVASTTSGQTARMIARNRPTALVVGITARPETYRRLALTWGVHPLLCAPTNNTDEMLAEAVDRALAAGFVHPGETVVISAGVPVGVPGNTNLIKVRQV